MVYGLGSELSRLSIKRTTDENKDKPYLLLPYFRRELPTPVLHDGEAEGTVDIDIDPVKPYNMTSGQQQLSTRIRKLVRKWLETD